MANVRHYYVREEFVGKVAILAIDDLEKMPLDQLAYNGKSVQAVNKPTLAPTSNYGNGRKLVFTSMIVLTLDTIANQQREQKKRPKLTRYVDDPSSLPLAAMKDFVTAEDGVRNTVEITSTDRSGIPPGHSRHRHFSLTRTCCCCISGSTTTTTRPRSCTTSFSAQTTPSRRCRG